MIQEAKKQSSRKERWVNFWKERDRLVEKVKEAKQELEDYDQSNKPDRYVAFSICPVMIRYTQKQKYNQLYIEAPREIPHPGSTVVFTNAKSAKVTAVELCEDETKPFFWLTVVSRSSSKRVKF